MGSTEPQPDNDFRHGKGSFLPRPPIRVMGQNELRLRTAGRWLLALALLSPLAVAVGTLRWPDLEAMKAEEVPAPTGPWRPSIGDTIENTNQPLPPPIKGPLPFDVVVRETHLPEGVRQIERPIGSSEDVKATCFLPAESRDGSPSVVALGRESFRLMTADGASTTTALASPIEWHETPYLASFRTKGETRLVAIATNPLRAVCLAMDGREVWSVPFLLGEVDSYSHPRLSVRWQDNQPYIFLHSARMWGVVAVDAEGRTQYSDTDLIAPIVWGPMLRGAGGERVLWQEIAILSSSLSNVYVRMMPGNLPADESIQKAVARAWTDHVDVPADLHSELDAYRCPFDGARLPVAIASMERHHVNATTTRLEAIPANAEQATIRFSGDLPYDELVAFPRDLPVPLVAMVEVFGLHGGESDRVRFLLMRNGIVVWMSQEEYEAGTAYFRSGETTRPDGRPGMYWSAIEVVRSEALGAKGGSFDVGLSCGVDAPPPEYAIGREVHEVRLFRAGSNLHFLVLGGDAPGTWEWIEWQNWPGAVVQ